MNERRSTFRINETIALEFKQVADTTANSHAAELEFPTSAPLRLFNELRKLDAENTLLFHQIRESNRQVADYLQNLNRKIDLLSQEILNESPLEPPTSSMLQVNLSEGGIAFGSRSPLTENSFIALKLTFLPSHAGLAVYAKVIRCSPTTKGEYQIGALFHNINEGQQQVIGQQIMRSQMAEKRSGRSPTVK
jgi:hypothetical protein